MSLDANEIYTFGPYRISSAERVLRRGGEIVPLTPKCVDTLLVLARNPGQVVDKETLMRAVWPDAFVEEGNLAQNIFTLRKTLGETPDGQRYIQTIPKRGYLLLKPQMEFAPAPEPASMPPAPPPSPAKYRMALAIGIALACVLAVAGWLSLAGRGRSSEIRITPLSVPNNVTYGVISPEGSRIAYVANDAGGQSLWIRPTTALDAGARIVGPLLGAFWGVTFAPSGDSLYYTFEDRLQPTGGALYRVWASGGAPSPILTGVSGAASVSPDGRRLVFKRFEGDLGLLLTATTSGGDLHVIASSGATYPFYAYRWADDGKHIDYVEGSRRPSGGLWTVFEIGAGPAGDRPTAVIPTQSKPIRTAVWLNRSEILAVVPDDGAPSSQIWRLSASAPPQRLTAGLNDYALLSSSANASAVLATNWETQDSIWTMPAAGGDPVLLKLPPGSYNDPVWTPDGRIVYVGQSNIWVATPDGAQRKPLLSTPVKATDPVVSADARFVVFTRHGDQATKLWRVDLDSGSLRQLTNGPLDSYPALSPDGRWMIFTSNVNGRRGISKAPVDAPQHAARLVDAYEEQCAIAPDGARFAFSDSTGAIQIRSFADGSLLSSVPASPDAGNLAWTPDGSAITYAVRDAGSVSIWRQPLAGGLHATAPSKPILRLPLDARRVAWSAPADRIVYLRRELKVDLALISNFR